MTSTAQYIPGVGVLLSLQGSSEGQTIIIRDNMLISAVERTVSELSEFLA